MTEIKYAGNEEIQAFDAARIEHFTKFDHLKKLPKKAKILFVCVGNINRSPACEIIFNDMMFSPRYDNLEWVCLSSGISPKNEGKLMSKKMRDVLIEMGYDSGTGILPEKRSIYLTDSNVAAADMIFIMDRANEKKMVERFGEQILAKLAYIGDWQTRKDRNIPDPHFHQGTEKHKEVALTLEGALHNLLEYHEDLYWEEVKL